MRLGLFGVASQGEAQLTVRVKLLQCHTKYIMLCSYHIHIIYTYSRTQTFTHLPAQHERMLMFRVQHIYWFNKQTKTSVYLFFLTLIV